MSSDTQKKKQQTIIEKSIGFNKSLLFNNHIHQSVQNLINYVLTLILRVAPTYL